MAYGESNDHVTDDLTWPWKVKFMTPKTPRAQYLENSWMCYLATIANCYVDSLLWSSTVDYPRDTLASCVILCLVQHVRPGLSVKDQHAVG